MNTDQGGAGTATATGTGRRFGAYFPKTDKAGKRIHVIDKLVKERPEGREFAKAEHLDGIYDLLRQEKCTRAELFAMLGEEARETYEGFHELHVFVLDDVMSSSLGDYAPGILLRRGRPAERMSIRFVDHTTCALTIVDA